MFRHSDFFQMAGFTFATSLLSADRNHAVLNPAALLFKMYRDHFGTIPVDVAEIRLNLNQSILPEARSRK